jgi:hypothetical protein
MSSSVNSHPEANLDHPRAKVELLLALLSAHRELERPRSRHWHERELELIRRLAAVQVELDAWQRGR